MNNEEVVKIKLPSGYNVTMSAAAYQNKYLNFSEPQFYNFISYIHAGLYFPQIMQFIAVTVTLLAGKTSLVDILLINIVNGIAFTVMWFWCRTYKIPMLSFVICVVGKYAFKFFIHYIILAVIIFFVVKDWKVFLYCIIGGIVTHIITNILSSVLSSTKYNDEVVSFAYSLK